MRLLFATTFGRFRLVLRLADDTKVLEIILKLHREVKTPTWPAQIHNESGDALSEEKIRECLQSLREKNLIVYREGKRGQKNEVRIIDEELARHTLKQWKDPKFVPRRSEAEKNVVNKPRKRSKIVTRENARTPTKITRDHEVNVAAGLWARPHGFDCECRTTPPKPRLSG
jgi:hypothetical protein